MVYIIRNNVCWLEALRAEGRNDSLPLCYQLYFFQRSETFKKLIWKALYNHVAITNIRFLFRSCGTQIDHVELT